MRYDPLYVLFIYYFNEERDYFECHEVLEELWLEEGRNPIYQGLLQVAVGLYHFRNGNNNGAVKLLTQAVNKLENAEPQALGINMQKILQQSKEYLHRLEKIEEQPFDFYDLTIEVIDSKLDELVRYYIDHPPSHEEED